MPKRRISRKFVARKRRYSGTVRSRGRGFRVRSVRKLIKAARTKRISKKLHAVQQYGIRLAPKALIAKLKWFNNYGAGDWAARTDFTKAPLQLDPGETYQRTWNLSSIWKPDTNDPTSTTTVFNYKEYQPYYSKFLVRGNKVVFRLDATSINGSENSETRPLAVYFWCDNNNTVQSADINTENEAFIQPGKIQRYVQTNPYQKGSMRMKKYYSAQRILKRPLVETDDYGTIATGTGTASGQDPPQNSTMFFHMLLVNNNTANGGTMYITYALDLTFYTKLWDYLPDKMDQEDPDA